MLPSIRSSLALLICLIVTGCQPGGRVEPKKYPVSGTVTLDGKPLNDNGFVYFKTIVTGAIDGIEIIDGKFSGKAESGDRRVEIVAYKTKVVDFDGMKGETKESLIPSRYNAESDLTAKVTPEGPNQFLFELTSDAGKKE